MRIRAGPLSSGRVTAGGCSREVGVYSSYSLVTLKSVWPWRLQYRPNDVQIKDAQGILT